MGWDESFLNRVNSKSLVIGVVGLGYVGLPTALSLHQAGFKIWGIDISSSVIDNLNNEINPTGDPSLDGIIPNPNNEMWNITSSFSDSIPHCDVVLVTVPTPVNDNKSMDSSHVYDSGNSIFSNIKSDSKTIVILESTVYPGSTNEIWKPLIKKNNLTLGQDLIIAYCPERHNPGDRENNITSVARVIGCDDEQIGNDLVSLYSELTSGLVKFVGTIEVAESAKLVENIQRDINIALVNELATIFPHMGVDIEDVLDAASTKWNFHRYKPGLGVGGHCIPVDPYFIIDKAKFKGISANLVTSARNINEMMPDIVSRDVIKILNHHYQNKENLRVLILGWSYKADIGDSRESPSMPLYRNLEENNISVSCYDPYFSKNRLSDNYNFIDNMEDLSNVSMIVLATAHSRFLNFDWHNYLKIMDKPLIYDGRRCLNITEMEDNGWLVNAIGKPVILS